MPLRISLPPQRFLIHSTSFQFSVGSNCLPTSPTANPCRPRRPHAPRYCRSAALGAQHAQAPARLGRHVEDVGDGQLGRCGKAVFEVLMALADDLQVQREHQRRAFRGLGPVDQALHELAVADHIDLEPERVAVGAGSHVLDGADAHRGQGEGHAKLLGCARRQDLAISMLHASEADGRQRDRHGHVLPDHLRARAAVFHVDCHALAQLDLLEVGLVGAVGALGPAARIGIVVEHAWNALLRQHAQVFDVGDDGHCVSPRVPTILAALAAAWIEENCRRWRSSEILLNRSQARSCD